MSGGWLLPELSDHPDPGSSHGTAPLGRSSRARTMGPPATSCSACPAVQPTPARPWASTQTQASASIRPLSSRGMAPPGGSRRARTMGPPATTCWVCPANQPTPARPSGSTSSRASATTGPWSSRGMAPPGRSSPSPNNGTGYNVLAAVSCRRAARSCQAVGNYLNTSLGTYQTLTESSG